MIISSFIKHCYAKENFLLTRVIDDIIILSLYTKGLNPTGLPSNQCTLVLSRALYKLYKFIHKAIEH